MADFTMDRFSLKGKTALVTGAERGIGLEIAKGLATAGADIIIAGLMEEEFPKAEAAVRAKGGKLHGAEDGYLEGRRRAAPCGAGVGDLPERT